MVFFLNSIAFSERRWTILFAVILLTVVAPLLLVEVTPANTPERISMNETVWTQQLFSPKEGYIDEFVADVIVTDDGFLVVGWTEVEDRSPAGYIAMVDRNGTVRWERTPEAFEKGGLIAGTALGDGDYVLVGWRDDGIINVGGDLLIARYRANDTVAASLGNRKWL